MVSPDHGDCAITIVGVRGTDSGLWKCMVKDSVRAEEVWTEEAREKSFNIRANRRIRRGVVEKKSCYPLSFFFCRCP